MGGRAIAYRVGMIATLVLLGVSQLAAAQALPLRTVAKPATPTLRAVPQGAAVRLSALRNNAAYRDTFAREFDSLTPENALKMAALQPRRGQFDFAAADELVDYARRNGKAVHGHTLVWGLSLPLWLVDHGATDRLGLRLPPIVLPRLPRPLDKLVGDTTTLLTGWRRDELVAIMRDHITTVMRHFAGRVGEWDVVNEPIAEDGSPAQSVWRRFIGPDYIDIALRAAHAADPKAKLFINDFAVEAPSRKLDGLLGLVRGLQDRGVPLDGIGLQMHTNIVGYHDEATLASTMRRFAAMGLQVQVTEMDVGTSLLDNAGLGALDRPTRQADAYGAAARACNAVSACTRFTTWGISDALSWLGASESPLLFDRQFRAKPAYAAVRNAFAPRSAKKLTRAVQPRRWRWRPGTGARCGWGSCAGLRAGRG